MEGDGEDLYSLDKSHLMLITSIQASNQCVIQYLKLIDTRRKETSQNLLVALLGRDHLFYRLNFLEQTLVVSTAVNLLCTLSTGSGVKKGMKELFRIKFNSQNWWGDTSWKSKGKEEEFVIRWFQGFKWMFGCFKDPLYFPSVLSWGQKHLTLCLITKTNDICISLRFISCEDLIRKC